jgi:hypothetical protein
MTEQEKRDILRDYAAGRRGTRATLDALDMRDYADLIIALSQADLPFPPPVDSPAIRAHRARASEILMPRLTHGA